MKKCAIICILLVLAASLSATAAVRVTNLYMEKNSQFTEFTIACDSDFKFEQQIVEATKDKPYRIVVDILDAVHRLPQWEFDNIPKSSIIGVRTSQFSVEPREIVRVVLDVKGNLTYKVKKEGDNLVLFVNTPDDAKFARWVAAPNEPDWPTLAQHDKLDLTPARPGNEANAPQVTKPGQPAAEKKPTETKTPATKPQLAQIPPPKSEDLSPFNDLLVDKGTDPSQLKHSEPEPKAKQTATTPAKQVDTSNLMPPTPLIVPEPKPTETKVEPEPKAAKSALPETKVTAKPRLAQHEEVVPAPPTSLPKPQVDDTPPMLSDEITKSTANSIREKYAARVNGQAPAEQGQVETYEEKPVLDKVERIRQKYKHGIEFVANDDDAARLAAKAERERQQAAQDSDGAPRFYDEFIPQRDVVMYSSDGQRDPFAPLVDLADEMAAKSDLPDVATLKLIGVLQDNETNRALFEDYAGYAYIMETGDRVRNGFLASIHEDHVVFQIRQYGWSRQVAVQLEDEM